MNWQFHYPTRVFFGARCLEANASSLSRLGRKALIVTGQGGSARRNGALEDIEKALSGLGISSQLFDRVEANPSIDNVRAGARAARDAGADFIVAAGGGSPMDAAKAIAILACNSFSDEELFHVVAERVLPLAAVPTTSGTGSEVTPYSILTWPAIENKRSIFNPAIYPAVAFLDPDYTSTLPRKITVDTAVDAYSHALESCLSRKASPFSEMLALEALSILGPELRQLLSEELPGAASREQLLYGSMLAGLAISITGTNIPHALGYAFTYRKDIPHGRANGFIMPSYIDFLLEGDCGEAVLMALRKSGFRGSQDFRQVLEELCGPPPALNAAEREIFVAKTLEARNLPASLRLPDAEQLARLLESCYRGIG